jgi:hypothetical protein
MAGALVVANTAVSSANVAVVDSLKVGRSAGYSRYNNDPRRLPFGYTAQTAEISVYLNLSAVG